MQLLQQHTPLHPKLILEVIEIPKMFLFSAKKNTMYNVQMHSLLTLLWYMYIEILVFGLVWTLCMPQVACVLLMIIMYTYLQTNDV